MEYYADSSGGSTPALLAAAWQGPGYYDTSYVGGEPDSMYFVAPYVEPPAAPAPSAASASAASASASAGAAPSTGSGTTSSGTSSSGTTASDADRRKKLAAAGYAPPAELRPGFTSAKYDAQLAALEQQMLADEASKAADAQYGMFNYTAAPPQGYQQQYFGSQADAANAGAFPLAWEGNADAQNQAWKGAGYYGSQNIGTQGDYGNEESTLWSFLGAQDPSQVYTKPGEAGTWNYGADTGFTQGTPGYDEGGYNPGGRTLADFYGPMGRDQFLSQMYAPYAGKVAGLRAPDEFIGLAQRSMNTPYLSTPDGGWKVNPDYDSRYDQVLAGSDNPSQAGRANNPLSDSLALMNAYMNQPALVAARGGARWDWSQEPSLQQAYDQGQTQAKAQAQQIHDINTGGAEPWLQTLMKAVSVMSPGLPALGGAANAAMTGGLAGLEALAAAAPAYGSSASVLGSLGLRGLGIVSPQLGSIASLAQGIGGMLPGGLGGLADSFSGLASGFGGADAAANAFAGLGDAGGSWDVLPDELKRRGLSSLDSAESLFRAPIESLNTEAGLSAALRGDFLGNAAGALSNADLGNQDMGYGETGTVKPAGLPGAEGGMSASQVLGTAQKAASLAKQVAALLGGDDGAQQQNRARPQRAEGQTDQEYSGEVADWAVKYLDLDTKAMEKAGFVPGSAEYTKYVLDQADSVISQIFSKNPEALQEGESVEGLQAQLKDLTQRELRQLDRALFVRGELGKMMGAGDYLDPFSGRMEEVSGPGLFSSGKAAYQRGLARSTGELAGLRGGEARQYLGGMLGRDADLYGLQAQQDAAAARARLLSGSEDMGEEERKRRASGNWASLFENQGETALQDAFKGIDTGSARGQRAVLQAIFGE